MDKNTALELYTLFRHENSSWLTSHREHSQQYLALVAAILAASIAAVSQLAEGNPLILSLIAMGPILNVFLCRIAILMCNRSYQAYLEGISIQAKLEPVIGLSEKRDPPVEDKPEISFPKDNYFLPERWLKSRHFATTDKFVEDGLKRGANAVIQLTFDILRVLNALFAFGLLAWVILIIFSISLK